MTTELQAAIDISKPKTVKGYHLITMILILTRPFDVHADKVIEELNKRSIRYARLHTSEFPTSLGLELGFNPNICHIHEMDGESINIDDVETVWNRRPSAPEFPAEVQNDHLRFASAESVHVLRGLWCLLADRFWINSYDNSYAAAFKPYQLSVAQELDFRIPRTLMTNCPEHALHFFDECNGGVIYKTFSSYHQADETGAYKGIYTNLISREQLVAGSDRIKLAPCIFQEYIRKMVELRVTVIGDQIFAAEIDSQSSARSTIDWRRYDFAQTPYRKHDLPKEIQSAIKSLMRRLGIVFGCLDFIMTPQGEYVFLEINPNGQWYWIELLTGFPLLSTFVELLLSRRGSPRRRLGNGPSTASPYEVDGRLGRTTPGGPK